MSYGELMSGGTKVLDSCWLFWNDFIWSLKKKTLFSGREFVFFVLTYPDLSKEQTIAVFVFLNTSLKRKHICWRTHINIASLTSSTPLDANSESESSAIIAVVISEDVLLGHFGTFGWSSSSCFYPRPFPAQAGRQASQVNVICISQCHCQCHSVIDSSWKIGPWTFRPKPVGPGAQLSGALLYALKKTVNRSPGFKLY